MYSFVVVLQVDSKKSTFQVRHVCSVLTLVSELEDLASGRIYTQTKNQQSFFFLLRFVLLLLLFLSRCFRVNFHFVDLFIPTACLFDAFALFASSITFPVG